MGLPHDGQSSATLATGIGMSLSMMPPCMVARVGLLVLLGDVDAVDDDLALAGRARMTSPSLPRSLPVSTRDAVALLDLQTCHHSTSGASETMRMNFLSRSSRPTGPKMRVPRGLLLVVDEHGGVLVEADVAAVGTALLLLDADDDALDDVALLDGGAGDGVLDGGDEDVADRGVAPAWSRRAP